MRLLCLLLLILLALPALAQPIYRVVDEHGNVTYTDQKPSDDAQPLRLPELSVVGADRFGPPVASSSAETAAAQGEDTLGFRITEPLDGARLVINGDSVLVSMDSHIELPPAALIVLVLDEQPLPPVRGMVATVDGIEPGIHRLRAELQTESGRVLAVTDTVEFEVEIAADMPRP